MKLNEYNKKAIVDIYKNAHIALQSISDIMPSIQNNKIKSELQKEYEGYENMAGKISSFMRENYIEPKDINIFNKAVMWCSIKVKTAINSSDNQIAEMMIKGTVMGINELTAMKNEKANLKEQIFQLLEELLKLEEQYQQNLKKYL